MRPDDAVARFALAGVYVSTGRTRKPASCSRRSSPPSRSIRKRARCSRPCITDCSRKADGDRDACARAGAERRGAGAAARRRIRPPQPRLPSRRSPEAPGYFPSFRQISAHEPSALPSANQPTTMSALPSPSTSPRSSVACEGVPASSVCRSKRPGRSLLQPHQRGSVAASPRRRRTRWRRCRDRRRRRGRRPGRAARPAASPADAPRTGTCPCSRAR